MKKIISFLAFVVLAASCNKEKIYVENLTGTWSVYKYLLNNVDKSQQFKNQHGPDYTITFNSDKTFVEFTSVPDTAFTTGTYGFTDNDEKIMLTHQYFTFALDTAGDTTFIPHDFVREYTIFNLTRDHVQLRNDTSQLYMNKKTE